MNKVLHYYSYDKKIGGPRTYIKTIVESSLNQKYEFSECYQEEAANGINFSLLKRMTAKIKQENPDILHIHGCLSDGFYGVLAGKRAGCKHILLTVHGLAFDVNNINKIKYILYRYFVEPYTLKHADLVYTVCDYAAKRDAIKNNTKKNLFGYIHNPCPEISVTRTKQQVREEIGVTEDDFLITVACRISKDKGFDIYPIIAKEILKKHENAKFLVLGDGGYFETLKQSLIEEIDEKKVVLYGSTNKVHDFLSISDAYIFPSYHENLPISLVEAAAMGVPCVCSNVGGNPEAIIDGETGFIAKSQNPDEYVRLLEKLITDDDLRKQISEKAEKDATERFALEKILANIDEAYQTVLKG